MSVKKKFCKELRVFINDTLPTKSTVTDPHVLEPIFDIYRVHVEEIHSFKGHIKSLNIKAIIIHEQFYIMRFSEKKLFLFSPIVHQIIFEHDLNYL